MLTIIFSYNRPDMLNAIFWNYSEYGADVHIIDDGSDFWMPAYENTHVFDHGGKDKFGERWHYALALTRCHDHDLYVFTPDDFMLPDVGRIRALHDLYKEKPYVCNIVNDGREASWDPRPPKPHDEHTKRVYFTDCGFFCNRAALEKLGWWMNATPNIIDGVSLSSGVGKSLTHRFNKAGVTMLMPHESLAYHGDHESKMHPDRRRAERLVSR